MQDVLANISMRLKEAGIAEPRREARALIMAVTEIDPFLAVPGQAGGHGPMDPNLQWENETLEEAVLKRIRRIPLSKIIGTRGFYGREFITGEEVLDPRPDSETIIDQALKHCPDNARILDLGTGSGCLIVTMLAERSDVTGVAIDLSPAALDIAQQNAEKLGVSDRIQFVEGDFKDASFATPFNLLLSNPPYIPSAEIDTLEPEVKDHDPRLALDGGIDGCDPYRVILARMRDFLLPESHFILEFSPDICEKVFRLAVQAGHKDVEIIRDLAGRERVLLGRCG